MLLIDLNQEGKIKTVLKGIIKEFGTLHLHYASSETVILVVRRSPLQSDVHCVCLPGQDSGREDRDKRQQPSPFYLKRKYFPNYTLFCLDIPSSKRSSRSDFLLLGYTATSLVLVRRNDIMCSNYRRDLANCQVIFQQICSILTFSILNAHF